MSGFFKQQFSAVLKDIQTILPPVDTLLSRATELLSPNPGMERNVKSPTSTRSSPTSPITNHKNGSSTQFIASTHMEKFNRFLPYGFPMSHIRHVLHHHPAMEEDIQMELLKVYIEVYPKFTPAEVDTVREEMFAHQRRMQSHVSKNARLKYPNEMSAEERRQEEMKKWLWDDTREFFRVCEELLDLKYEKNDALEVMKQVFKSTARVSLWKQLAIEELAKIVVHE